MPSPAAMSGPKIGSPTLAWAVETWVHTNCSQQTQENASKVHGHEFFQIGHTWQWLVRKSFQNGCVVKFVVWEKNILNIENFL